MACGSSWSGSLDADGNESSNKHSQKEATELSMPRALNHLILQSLGLYRSWFSSPLHFPQEELVFTEILESAQGPKRYSSDTKARARTS